LAVLLPFALAAPAHAAFDWSTNVIDFEFQPKEQTISVGDSVTWHFTVGGHTSTSVAGQPDSWKSIDDGTNDPGDTFTHTFNRRGRYQYVCSVHKSFMKGVIEVGTDTVADTIDTFRTRRFGNRVRVGFRLNEPATVKYRLTGPSPRRVKLGRLAKGLHRFGLRHLKQGSYRGTLTVVDDFDHKVTGKKSFVIR
jgi:plastocyanin